MIVEVAKLAGRLAGASIAAILVLMVMRPELPLSLPLMVVVVLAGSVIFATPMVLWSKAKKTVPKRP